MTIHEVALSLVAPEHAPLLAFCWLLWELYCPFPSHQTKLQRFHEDLTARFERIEITQLAIAEEVSGVDAEEIKDIHDKSGLTPSQLKED